MLTRGGASLRHAGVRRVPAALASMSLLSPMHHHAQPRGSLGAAHGGAAAGLQRRHLSVELGAVWVLGAIVPVLIAGWSPTPIARNPLTPSASTSGAWHKKPLDAPPGWLPPPSHWQPGMPSIAFPNNVIPPREGFRQWEEWESLWFYGWGLFAVAYFWWLPNWNNNDTEDVGHYWLARVASDEAHPRDQLPLMDPFDVLEIGCQKFIWHDRYAMTFWAQRFQEQTDKTKEIYWQQTCKNYCHSREEFDERIKMFADPESKYCVDMEALTFAFVPESNGFLDEMKVKILALMNDHANGRRAGQWGPQWRRQMRSLTNRLIDDDERAKHHEPMSEEERESLFDFALENGILEKGGLTRYTRRVREEAAKRVPDKDEENRMLALARVFEVFLSADEDDKTAPQ